MKLGCLIVSILLTVLAGVAFVVCLLLPAFTSNRVSFDEAMLGLIPSAIVFCLGFILTVVAAILFFKGKKAAAKIDG